MNNSVFLGTLLDGQVVANRLTEHHQGLYRACITLFLIILVLAIFTLAFGVASWILLPKWRQIQFYVFLNLAVGAYMHMIGLYVYFHYEYSTAVVIILTMLSRTTLTHLLLVTTVMFYMEIVQVFNITISMKYVKVNLISWALPCVEVSLEYAIHRSFNTSLLLITHYVTNTIVMLVCVGLYVKMFHDLIIKIGVKKETQREICMKIFLAASCFITSGIASVFPLMVLELVHADLTLYLIAILIGLVTVITGHVAFFSIRPHRELWAEYWYRRGTTSNV